MSSDSITSSFRCIFVFIKNIGYLMGRCSNYYSTITFWDVGLLQFFECVWVPSSIKSPNGMWHYAGIVTDAMPFLNEYGVCAGEGISAIYVSDMGRHPRPQDIPSRQTSDDNECSDVVLAQRAIVVKPSHTNTDSTPPRKFIFGLPTPQTPIPRSRFHSFNFNSASPSPLPRNTPNGAKLLTSAGEPSEQPNEGCIGSATLSPSAEIPTPNNTPPRDHRLLCWEGAVVKSESSATLSPSAGVPTPDSTPPRDHELIRWEEPVIKSEPSATLSLSAGIPTPDNTPPRNRGLICLGEAAIKSESSATLSLSAGIPTPDNTPPRNRGLICQEETFFKSESSDSPETSSQSVAERTETSPTAELLQDRFSGISEPENGTESLDDQEASVPISSAKAEDPGSPQSKATTQCSAITSSDDPRKWMLKPQRCHDHLVTHDTSITPVTSTGPAVVPIASIKFPQYNAIGPNHIPAARGIPIIPTIPTSPTPRYTANTPATELYHQCRGISLPGVRCEQIVKSTVQYCPYHTPAHHSTLISPTEPTSSAAQYTTADPDPGRCLGTTLRGLRCKRRVRSAIQYCHDHVPQAVHHSPVTPTESTASTAQYATLAADPDPGRCLGTTLRGLRCKRRVRSTIQYCHDHIPQATRHTPVTPTESTASTASAQYATADSDPGRCLGTTLRGLRCKRRVRSTIQYCHDHIPQAAHHTPVTPTASPASTAQYATADSDPGRCLGTTLRGLRCKRRVRFTVQYCHDHIPARGTPITPTAPTSPVGTLPYTFATPTADLGTDPGQCRGTTLRGVRCKRRVKFPAQHCHDHIPTHHTPITPTAPSPPAGTLQYTFVTPTAELGTQCHGITRHGIRCRRTVNYPAQHCYEHISMAYSIPGVPTAPTTQTLQYIATVPIYISVNQIPVQHYPQYIPAAYNVPTIPITPTKPPPPPTPARAAVQDSIDVNAMGFRVRRPGQKESFVSFSDYIPQYLQPLTQRKLREVICEMLTNNIKKPGYVYALNVADPEKGGEIAWKIGYSKNVEERARHWEGHSHITDLHWRWHKMATVKHEDNKASIRSFIGQRGEVCPVAANQLERLVHIELRDLETHEAYLHADWPNVKFSDVPRKSKAYYKSCDKCPRQHKEIFSFRRIKEGIHLGKEWEDVVEPVIRRWERFLMDYLA